MHTLTRAAIGAALALGLALPAAAQSDELETAEGQSQPIYNESVTEQYRIATDHGTIYGKVTRPVVPDGVKVPVILTYSPYNIITDPTNQTAVLSDSTASFYVPRGYARAVFDVVGTRESAGCYDYGGIRERETGKAVIEALAEFEWSNGRVGMIGGSYDGTTQLAAAIEQPKGLVTIVPQVAIDRWYDYAFGAGIRYFLNEENPSDEGFDTPLAFDFGFGFIPPLDVTSPESYGEAFGDRVVPCDRPEHTQRAYDLDPVYDEFWDERDYRANADKITASVMIEGGWLDHNVKHWNSTRMFEALPDDLPKRLVMGQWGHSGNRFGDGTAVRHAWFDHWLLGLDTGVMDLPAVDSQAGGTNERIQTSDWPPVDTIFGEVPLATEAGDGATMVLQNASAASWTDANKQLTERQVFSEGCSGECLLFEMAPVQATTRINGSPALELTLTSSQAETHFTPVLYEIDEAGATRIITRGFLNARNRNGLDVSEPLVPGEAYEATVEFWDVDWIVEPGRALGVALMSTNSVWALTDSSASTNTLDLSASLLRLPVSTGAEALGFGGVTAPSPAPAPAPLPEPEPAPAPLPATGGGLALAGLAALAIGARRRH